MSISIRLVRGSEVRMGPSEAGFTFDASGRRLMAHAELGTISAGLVSGPTLERLDGYVRLPEGLYEVESCRMDNGAPALRFISAKRTARPLTAKQRASLEAKPHGRFYVHGATAPRHVQGCVGVEYFSALGRELRCLVPNDQGEEQWIEGRRFDLEIVRG